MYTKRIWVLNCLWNKGRNLMMSLWGQIANEFSGLKVREHKR